MKALSAHWLRSLCWAVTLGVAGDVTLTRGEGVVAVCTETAIRAAMAGGGTVTFGCSGYLGIRNPLIITNDTFIDGTGHAIELGADGRLLRFFEVRPGATLRLKQLLIADTSYEGNAREGGAVFNNNGNLFTEDVVFRNHIIGRRIQYGYTGAAAGGAVYNAGGVFVGSNTRFESNGVFGGTQTNASIGLGGAIYNAGGEVRLTNCLFSDNVARGGSGYQSPAQPGRGGAIYQDGGSLIVADSRFKSNEATPGGSDFLPGAAGQGGAICLQGGSARIVRTLFESNRAWARTLGATPRAEGGAVFSTGSLEIENCGFISNAALGASVEVGSSYRPGPAKGGAIWSSGPTRIVGSTLAQNVAHAGTVGSDFKAAAHGGAIYHEAGNLEMTNCTVAGNTAQGSTNTHYIWENCSPFLANYAHGGGLYVGGGSCTLVNVTLAANHAKGAPPHCNSGPTQLLGFGGNIATAPGGSALLKNSIVGYAVWGQNVSGNVTDGGRNINSDSSGSFGAPGSLQNTDPKLGPLADYGGAWQTMALLGGSPAIDQADAAAAPAIDQRGRARPYGSEPDIGAFESSAPFSVRGRIYGYRPPTVLVRLQILAASVNPDGSYALHGLTPDSQTTVQASASDARFRPPDQMVNVTSDLIGIDFMGYRSNGLAIARSSPNTALLTVAGAPNSSVSVQFQTDAANWRSVGTNSLDSNGLFDLTWTNLPGRVQLFRGLFP